MSSRKQASSDLTTLDLDHDPADIPPDEPTYPPVPEPEPEPSPPGWMLSQALRVGVDLSLYPMNRLPTLRSTAIRAMSEPEPLLDVPAAAIRAALLTSLPAATNFINAGQAERVAARAWLDGVADEVIASRAAGFARATEQKRLADEAEAERLYRIENAAKIAEDERWAAWEAQQAEFEAYKAGLADAPQPVA